MQERHFTVKGQESFFIRQIGINKPLYLLNTDEATKIITGLEKLRAKREKNER